MLRLSLIALILLAPSGLAAGAAAGWVTIKNETAQPIVIQETCLVKNQLRRGKPVRLMPGEVLREYQACPGSKTVHILDCGGQMRTLGTGELSWAKGDYSFAVRPDGTAVRLQSADAGRIVARADLPRGK